MKKRIIVYGILLVLLVASGAAYYSHIQGEIEKNEAKREAEERYRRHLKLEQSEEYNPGWTGEGVVKNLREALEAAPANYEIRMKLAQVLNERRGHSDNMLEQHCRVLEGGLDYMDRYEPEQRQKLIRGISIRCQQQIYPEMSRVELQQMWIDQAPYTEEAISRRLGLASAKAKRGAEDALEYIEQTRERVKEYARRTDTKPEKKLMYLDYLEGVYWKKKGEYEKSGKKYWKVISYIQGLPKKQKTAGLPVNNLSYGKVLQQSLQIFESAQQWKYIKETLRRDYKNYTMDTSKWMTLHRQLWNKANSNLSEGEN